MLLRFAVFGLMALGLCGFGTVAWLSFRPPPTPEAIASAAPVVVMHGVLAAWRRAARRHLAAAGGPQRQRGVRIDAGHAGGFDGDAHRTDRSDGSPQPGRR